MYASREADNEDICCKHRKSKQKVRLNMILQDETARVLLELKNRGIIRSYADGVNQAIRLFYEKITQQDLISVRLKALEKGIKGNEPFDAE